MPNDTGADGAANGQHQGADSRNSGDPARQPGESGGNGAGDQWEAAIRRVLASELPRAVNGAVTTHLKRELARLKLAAAADDSGDDGGEPDTTGAGQRKPNAEAAEVAKLRRELREMKESAERDKREAADRARRADLVSRLAKADVVDPERIARVMADELSVDDDGRYVGKDDAGNPLTLDEAITAFAKSNPWARKPVKGAAGGGSVGDAKHGGSGPPAGASSQEKLAWALAQRGK